MSPNCAASWKKTLLFPATSSPCEKRDTELNPDRKALLFTCTSQVCGPRFESATHLRRHIQESIRHAAEVLYSRKTTAWPISPTLRLFSKSQHRSLQAVTAPPGAYLLPRQ